MYSRRTGSSHSSKGHPGSRADEGTTIANGLRDQSATTDAAKREFARLLWRLADLVRVAEPRRSFRARAYRGAVWALDAFENLDATDEQFLATPGIGPGVTALINEYRSSGLLDQLIPLEEAYPEEAPRLRRLPRMTPKMLRELKGLGIEKARDLRTAIETGAAHTVKGVGTQTLDLWHRILELPPTPSVVPAHEAWIVAEQLVAHLSTHTHADVHIAGAVRRVEEWVDRVDLVLITDQPSLAISFLDHCAVLTESSASQGKMVGRTHTGLRVEAHLTPTRSAGTALFIATGPPDHVYGVQEGGPHPTEEEVYRSSGMAWIPPAARGRENVDPTRLVGVAHLRGDLHLHSEASPDGRMSLETLCHAAEARGYEYVAVTDHTHGLRFGGLSGPEIEAQTASVDRIRAMFPGLAVFHGAELNITQDGKLDVDDEYLEKLDFAVAGVHSHFGLDRESQTRRVITALSHPVVRVLAHPFGRRIGIRPPLDLDMESVIEGAVVESVALETNGHRDRLDLPPDWIEFAAEKGALFAANSDAHRVHEMGNINNAVASLQRAGVSPDRIINTFQLSELSVWLESGSAEDGPRRRVALGGEGGI